TYSIKPGNFAKMVSKYKMTPEQMPQRYNAIEAELQTFITSFYFEKQRLASSGISLFDNNTETVNEIRNALVSQFSDLEIYEYIPYEISIPDILLYNKAKEIYLKSLESENRIIYESRAIIAEQEIRDAANFETLKKYGELLTEYPSLLDFFSVIEINCDSIIPKINIDLPKEPDQKNSGN
ncbi:MAG: hypothetical protein L3J12_00460, partial [Spirochaetales bacterium]|nr:hypothetical protein [Spirochaetales bacterium]